MKKPLLILISGHPTSGKTTLGKKISEKFNIPVIGIDGIRELLWDKIGWEHDKEEWVNFINAGFDLMYYFAEIILGQKRSIILESNFNPEMNNDRINKLKEKYDCELLQVHCHAKREILVERFEKRIKSDSYHPGHANGLYNIYSKDEYISRLGESNKLLDINGKTLKVDTTNPEKMDYDEIFEFIETNN